MISTDPILLERSVTRASFWQFVKAFWDDVPGSQPLVYNWHMEFLANELQTVAEDVFAGRPRKYDLVVNVSPGTSKSSLCSILFPCWVWTRMVRGKIIAASHTESLARDLATKSRSVLRGPHYLALFPEVQLCDDREAKLDYANTSGGERVTFTVGGKSPLGRHGDFQLVDDPIDAQKAVSELSLRAAEEFFTQTLPTRKTRKEVSVLILIMQRLHEIDPTGILLARAKADGGAPVRHLCLPAELTERLNPPELREHYERAGGLMDATRLSASVLKEFQATLGPYGYAGQFLQDPIPRGGGMFKVEHFNRRCLAAPYKARRVRAWDKAATEGIGACYTAGVLMALADDGCFYVEDCVHGQWNPDERDDIILATAYKDRSRYGPKYAPVIWVEQEPGSSGIDSFRYLAKKLAGFPVFADRPTGKKEVRAEPWASQCAARNVVLVESGWDLQGFLDEHAHFPLGRLKDRVDAAALAFAKLFVKRGLGDPLRVFTVRPGKRKTRIIVCSRKQLAEMVIPDQSAVLVNVCDPVPQPMLVGGSGDRSRDTDTGITAPPPHGLARLQAFAELTFADLDPAELQDCWEEPVERFGKIPGDLVMGRDDGKRLWKVFIKHQQVELLILADDGDRRALSLAYAVCDTLNLPRRETIYVVGKEEWKADAKDVPPNAHAYGVAKQCRALVVG